MPRLNDADVARLLAGIGGQPPAAAQTTIPTSGNETAPDEIASLRARLTAAARGGSLTQALDAALRDYLGCAVTFEATGDAPVLVDSMRFEGGEPLAWHLDIAGPFAAVLGDLMIGGDGTNVRHTNRRRLGHLLEPLATRLAAIVANTVEEAHAPMRFIEIPRRSATPLVGGSFDVGRQSGGWVAGAALRSPRTPASNVLPADAARVTPSDVAALPRGAIPESRPPRVERTADAAQPKAPREIVHPVMEPAASMDARQLSSATPRERVIGQKPAADADDRFAGAVAAACSRLSEIARCEAVAGAIEVTRVEAPVLSRDALKLALIAGGQGSLVLSADREAVTSVAAATVGAQTATGGTPGAVVVDAVEAVLRAALRGFAENLPGIAGGPQRFVRLAEGALPARSPHYAIAAPLHIGERAATLQWLVPTWMATSKGEERAPSDGR